MVLHYFKLTAMKTSLLTAVLLFCFAALMSTAFTGCSSGTKPGDTNVEIGHEKDKDVKAGGDKQGEGHHDNQPGADR